MSRLNAATVPIVRVKVKWMKWLCSLTMCLDSWTNAVLSEIALKVR